MKRFSTVLLVLTASAIGLFAGLRADRISRSIQLNHRLTESDSTVLAFGNAAASTDPAIGLGSDLGPVDLLWNVLKIIKNYYVDPVDPFSNSDMAHNAVRYMVTSLGDPNSQFLDKQDVQVLTDIAKGLYHGSGAILKIRDKKMADWTDQQLVVVSSLPGSPAEKSGLLPGDVIEEMDGKWVMTHDPLAEAYKVTKDFKKTRADRLKAWKDAKARRQDAITLTDTYDRFTEIYNFSVKVRRGGKLVPLSITLPDGKARPPEPKVETDTAKEDAPETEPVPEKPRDMAPASSTEIVSSKLLEGGIGYVRIFLFTADTPTAFAQSVKNLYDRGARKIALDLRNCPGGAVASIQAVAGLLMPGKPIGYIARSKGRKDTLTARAADALKIKYIALINEGTEGASELLAAGLRDSAMIKLIGQTTWGGGFERTAFRLPDGTGYTLTTGKFITPKGKAFVRTGIKPDVIIPMSPSMIGQPGDVQLEHAIAVLKRPEAG